MHVRRGIGISVFVLTAIASACEGGDDAGRSDTAGDAAGDTAAPRLTGTVTVFAAASLTGAFSDAEEAFETAHPGLDVITNFAASSALATQIAEGAPADVFASADQTSLSQLGSDGAAGEPVTFATNVLEIIVEHGNPLGITGLADLADPDLILTICAPDVPCGRYAAAIFANAGVEPAPDSFEENVKAVVTKVTAGEADAGLAYATDISAVDDRADGVRIPTEHNLIAEYPIVLTAEAPNPTGGQAWIDFITGADGRAILTAHGFGVP